MTEINSSYIPSELVVLLKVLEYPLYPESVVMDVLREDFGYPLVIVEDGNEDIRESKVRVIVDRGTAARIQEMVTLFNKLPEHKLFKDTLRGFCGDTEWMRINQKYDPWGKWVQNNPELVSRSIARSNLVYADLAEKNRQKNIEEGSSYHKEHNHLPEIHREKAAKESDRPLDEEGLRLVIYQKIQQILGGELE